MNAREFKTRLKELADPDQAAQLQRFFKTAPGEYGHGDRFHGIKVPPLRKLAQAHQTLPLPQVEILLQSAMHEDRLLALLILTYRFPTESAAEKRLIFKFYLKHTAHINNWDLVDLSAPHIVGAYLADKDKKPLYGLARSANLWERRIAIVATLHFIRQEHFEATLKIAVMLRDDHHDLIHKAVGWMLREMGKRKLPILEQFLKEHYNCMPRTMLRYAIERLPEDRRQDYLKGRV